jgi:hypothetical protein
VKTRREEAKGLYKKRKENNQKKENNYGNGGNDKGT